MEYKENIKIGFIQTVVEGNVAWGTKRPFNLNMSVESEEKVWAEIKKGFRDILNSNIRPQVIVIPELSIPRGHEYNLKRLCASSGAIVIAGLDFVWNGSDVSNKAVVEVPRNWPNDGHSKGTSSFQFGKTFYSQEEEYMFKKENLKSEAAMYILDAAEYGKMGVAICSDFFDIERFVVYKGRIHHLIIISHNKDTESYYFLAEAISRLVYCNVVICNSGEYGDSIGFSPFRENHNRIVYRHKGKSLFSTQVISLPVKLLDYEQNAGVENKYFKSRPPGYIKTQF